MVYENPTRVLLRYTILPSVRDIDCVTCSLAIERRLKKLDGVEKVGSAIMLSKFFVDYDESTIGIADIMKAIEKD